MGLCPASTGETPALLALLKQCACADLLVPVQEDLGALLRRPPVWLGEQLCQGARGDRQDLGLLAAALTAALQWAGQLGDGRAISLGELIGTDGKRWELQLKVGVQSSLHRASAAAHWHTARHCSRCLRMCS